VNTAGFLTQIIAFDDPASTADELALELRSWGRRNRCRGAVVGVSGGIDSAVTLALAARAFGPDRVVALMLPDRDSEPLSAQLGREAADGLGVKHRVVDITACLLAWDAYGMRDEAARETFPDYDPAVDGVRAEYRFELHDADAMPLFCLTRVRLDGATETTHLRPGPYRRIVAATNLKQRSRMTALYLEAERRRWAVIGTSNLLEIGQGFFVKHGDGAGDVFPLAPLYKTQVYQLAEVLGVPRAIIERAPTTDTYSATQTQQEFFYGLDVRATDLLWAAYLHDVDPEAVAIVSGMDVLAVRKVLAAFHRRSGQAQFLRNNPLAEPAPATIEMAS
jgi:NAD+ synthase